MTNATKEFTIGLFTNDSSNITTTPMVEASATATATELRNSVKVMPFDINDIPKVSTTTKRQPTRNQTSMYFLTNNSVLIGRDRTEYPVALCFKATLAMYNSDDRMVTQYLPIDEPYTGQVRYKAVNDDVMSGIIDNYYGTPTLQTKDKLGMLKINEGATVAAIALICNDERVIEDLILHSTPVPKN